jgi:predicted nucleic acid-binding protein
MKIRAGDRIFIDTNILIYASVNETPFHSIAVEKMNLLESKNLELFISRQVIREFIAVLTRPVYKRQPSISEIVDLIEYYNNILTILDDNEPVQTSLIELIQKFAVGGKQIHDANIVATMKTNKLNKLFTHNVQDFRRFEKLIKIIPLIE